MKEIHNVLIAGAGAIGSMVAWQCLRANPGKVAILARGERIERYRTTGFSINGEGVPFHLMDAASCSTPDLVIIACKYHHLGEVLSDLANHVGEGTLILSLLNGISSEEDIARAFGAERVPYGMIIGTDAGHHGGRTTFTKTGTIYFGDAENGSQGPASWSPRVRAIAEYFDRAGIDYAVPPDMYNRLWFKFMMNVGLNQVTAVLRQPYRILKAETRIPEAAELLEDAMREVIMVARAEGIVLTDADVELIYRTIDTLSDEGKTSMCQDVEAFRKTEVELFSGTVIKLARKHALPVPVNETLFKLLRALEQSYPRREGQA